MRIESWDDLLDVWFEEDENGVQNINNDLAPLMSAKFRENYERTVRRIVNENTVYAHTRRTVEVIARKPRARRGRRRR